LRKSITSSVITTYEFRPKVFSGLKRPRTNDKSAVRQCLRDHFRRPAVN
jgi:hypothetical protein